MKLKQVRISPEIKLYYSIKEPDLDLVKKASLIFTGSIEPFKTKHRHQVYLLEHNSEVYYAKKFTPPTIEQELSYHFRNSKAVNCLNISNKLRATGFKSVETVFALNCQRKWKHESILVTKKNSGIDLKEFLKSEINNSDKDEIMNRLISTLGAFYKSGFSHYDPVLTNFFIDPNQKPYEIVFLDFDSIIYKKWVSPKRTFYFFSKFFYLFFAFLVSQNDEAQCSREKVLFYLEIFLKTYNPAIKIDEAYKYLYHGTAKLLKRKDKLSIKNKKLLSKIIDLNAC